MSTRPTFDESWYRIADLTPRLRSSVQSLREVFRGQILYLMYDPSQRDFLKMSEAGYAFIGLLDGRQSVSSAWRTVMDRLGDGAPTQGEVLQLLGQLYQHNLLESNLPPDAASLFHRMKKRTKREVGSYLANILYARIPLWNPDRFLTAACVPLGWTFSWVGFALWSVLCLVGLAMVADHHTDILRQAESAIAPSNLFLLYISTLFIRSMHEFGHGLAIKKMGQNKIEVRVVGILFMQFLPLSYLDTSSSWGIPSKWKRAVVGAGGMYFELAVVAIAAMIWSRSADGSATHAIAYNLMFVAGFSTVLFNANPLVKYDGYYIMSDLLEIPNLAQRATARLSYLTRKHVFKVKGLSDPATTPFEKWFLIVYAVVSACYKVFLTVSIALFVADQYFFLGIIIAVVGLSTGLVWPLIKGIRYVLTSPELSRNRPRALAWSGFAATAAVLLLGVIPMPDRGRAEGVLEPVNEQVVYAPVDGFLIQMPERGAAIVKDGLVVVLFSTSLQTEHDKAAADIVEYQARLTQAGSKETALAQAWRERLQLAHETRSETARKLAALATLAKQDGVWVRNQNDKDAPRLGAFVHEGEEIGRVVLVGQYRLRLATDQDVGGRMEPELWGGLPVELRGRECPEQQAAGTIAQVMPAGRTHLPSSSLGHTGGGELIVKNDPKNPTTTEAYFDVRIALADNDDKQTAKKWLPGQRVQVRLDFGRTPLLVQGWRLLSQTLQRRFGV